MKGGVTPCFVIFRVETQAFAGRPVLLARWSIVSVFKNLH